MADIVWAIEIDGTAGLQTLGDLDEAIGDYLLQLDTADETANTLANDLASHFANVDTAQAVESIKDIQDALDDLNATPTIAPTPGATPATPTPLPPSVTPAPAPTPAPLVATPTPPPDAIGGDIAGPLSTLSLEQARLELQATEKSAEGLRAAIALAMSEGGDSQLSADLQRIQADVAAGVASITEGLRAVTIAEMQSAQRFADGEKTKRTEMQSTRAAVFQAIAAYDMAKNALMGWIRAGLAGTAEAALMQTQFSLLSREIAGVFKPVIDGVNDALRTVRDTLAGMSGETQETIRNIVGATAAFAGTLMIIPKVTSAIASLKAVMNAAAMANPWSLAIAGLAALLVGTETGREAAMGLVEAFGGIAEAISPILVAVGEIAAVLGEGLMAPIKAFADFLKAVVVPIFDRLKPVFEFIGEVLKLLAKGIGWVMSILGIKKKEDEEKKPKSAVSNAGGNIEDLEGTFKRIQSAALKTDIAQATRERMEGHLAAIRRLVSRHAATPLVA